MDLNTPFFVRACTCVSILVCAHPRVYCWLCEGIDVCNTVKIAGLDDPAASNDSEYSPHPSSFFHASDFPISLSHISILARA